MKKTTLERQSKRRDAMLFASTRRERALRRLNVSPRKLSAFCRRNQIQELALFGSALRDEFSPASDFDFLVSFEPGAQVGFLELARAQRELGELLKRKVDLVPKNGLKPRIRDEIIASSMAVYAA